MLKKLRPEMIVWLIVWSIVQATGPSLVSAAPKNSDVISDTDFVIVTVKSEESLASLAGQYLGSIHKAWQIADYNGISSVTPGQRLVIPLRPIAYGGLDKKGYQTVPILYYSKLTADSDDKKRVSAADFDAQLQFLRENGYRTVSLDLFVAFLNFEEQLPPRTVIISFDSTERWVYDIAYPILLRHGFQAALFVRTDRMDQPGHLTWQEIAKLAAAGFDIGTSGLSAKMLTRLPTENDPEAHLKALELEIGEPRKIIQTHLKRPCHYFAYPAGLTDDLVVALLKKHGYKAAFTRRGGSNPFFVDTYKIRRSIIQKDKDPLKFQELLTTFNSMDLR
jgi:peptidoglycan/xylan/chitin deacetylase (PgdA/CDA1 family)